MGFDFSKVQATEESPQVPAIREPLDMEAVKAAFGPYREKIETMRAQAEALVVKDDQTESSAVDSAAQAKKLVAQLEVQRKEVIAEPDRFVRDVNGFVRLFKKPLDDVVEILRGKIANHQYTKELERRKAAAAMAEESRKLQERLKTEAKAAGVEAPTVTPVPIPKQETVTRTESGASAHIRTEWSFEITDPAQVPRDYLMPDEKRIAQAVKGGIRAIPGVRIFEKPVTVLRG